MTTRPDALVRRASTKYWGALAFPALLLGFVAALTADQRWAALSVPAIALGVFGVLRTGQSAYHRRRGRQALSLDERELMVLSRAYSYAFRAVAVVIVLFVFYASYATQPERQWWIPSTSGEWRSLLWPLVLALPVLPAVIAEWLDPVETEVRDHGGRMP